jgi:DNA-binding winged helix-turn-helix (wHTH) protein
MWNNPNHLSGKRKYMYGLILLLFSWGICAAFSMYNNDDFNIAKREVVLRSIGHELLLQSGDSTSRVLPVNKISANEYQISFEKKLTFKPESLVNTTLRLLAKDPLAHDYVVNVLNCDNAAVIYGYAITQNEKDDIVPCKGRTQPTACYKVDIRFKPTGITTTRNLYLLGGLPLLAFVGFIFSRPAKQQVNSSKSKNPGIFTFGSVSFDPEGRLLNVNQQTIDLTGTETRLLLILATLPNQVVERSQLQKEIWEDEGVIVGRSLDMFISKLRKKLEADPKVKIINIRSKGYKLEISD